MLLNLTILDLAVVKTLDLDLEPGLSVLTGETGAGKSILLTALGLALGDRADSGYVRPGAKRAEVNLEFGLGDAPLARAWLTENELDDGEQCLIRRVVNEDGRSKAYVNNRPVTLQSLQALSEKLVEIHGQHAHLTLLNADEQRRLLDQYAKNQALLDQLNACHRLWQQAHRELTALKKASRDHSEREELLRYQLDELNQLDLAHFDYQALSDEHAKQANLGQILSAGQRQLDLLYENDEGSVLRLLGHAANELQPLARFAPELGNVGALLSEARIQIEEAASDLRRFLESQEADPRLLQELEDRIGVIQSLSRKHHVAPDELPELAHKFAHELDNLTHSEERIGTLESEVAEAFGAYQRLAAKLSAARQDAGLRLGRQISATIKELGMPQGEFQVDVKAFDNDEPKANGLDKIEFLVSANPGMPPKPLAKVASGGELARISLAIQVTTSSDKSTPTMIFDEVDSGIGGGIAEIVGQKLRRLSQNRQVMCVTHLPQVAAQAHHHLFVSKNQQTDVTASSVRVLGHEERVLEIARMLGGVNLTENTLAHAREMLTLGNSPE